MTVRQFPAGQFPVGQLAEEVAQAGAFAGSVERLLAQYRQKGRTGTEAFALLASLHEALLAFVDAPADLAVRAEAERLGSLFVELTGTPAGS
ncbi:hypothetical protein ACIRBX_00025 [Kitasatospora sp. NPDC096147]|uniref:hypothetical protein n=1 Tax=Kitasatospora sp. NPDC096147 TaxID=3364093 RepID=UPI00380F9C1C